MMNSVASKISTALDQNLVFIHGKGGVGKTVVSLAIALAHSQKGSKTLWVTVEDPTGPKGEIQQLQSSLWHLNCDFTQAFDEYAGLKIGSNTLTRIFLKNKVMGYLARAAPGVHELVLLGKIWYERNHYSRVIVDLPSTGYSIAMFQSAENFSKLFRGGPLHRDAEAMLATFRDPKATGHLIVSLPEEMPLQESLELNQHLERILGGNPAVFLANRLFPQIIPAPALKENDPAAWAHPFAKSGEDYASKRVYLEHHNLRIWRDEKISFGEFNYIPPPESNGQKIIAQGLAEQLKQKGYL